MAAAAVATNPHAAAAATATAAATAADPHAATAAAAISMCRGGLVQLGGGGGLTVSHSQMNKEKAFFLKKFTWGLKA